MGKQRGAPAGEGCWIPAGAKAASGRDRERAVACARHGGRDTPPGLLAAFPMERRDRAAPVPGAGGSHAGWGLQCPPQVWVPARQARQSRSRHLPKPVPTSPSHPPVAAEAAEPPPCPVVTRFPSPGWTDATRAAGGHRVPPAHGWGKVLLAPFGTRRHTSALL